MPLPWNLTIDPITGVLSGTPRTAPGLFSYKVRATNYYGFDEKMFQMTLQDSDTNPYLCIQNLGELRTFMLNNPLGVPDRINSSRPVLTLHGNGALCQYHISIDGVQLPDIYYCNMYSSVGIHTPPLADGVHTITGIEITPSPGALCVPYTFTVDTKPPVAPIITEAYFSLGTVVVKGTCVSDVNSIHVREGPYLRGGADGTTGTWVVGILNMPSGSHSFHAVGLDKAGNISADSNVVTVVVP